MSDKSTAVDLFERSFSEPLRQRRATLLEAIELADADNDLELGFKIRKSYVNASHANPDPLMMIAHYGWCLARHDEDPERYPLSLWNYKWLLEAAPKYAGVSREQLRDLADDLRQRFEAVGASRGPAGVARCSVDAALGEYDKLEVSLDEWRNTPRGGHLNDCSACDVSSEVRFLSLLGRHQDAIDAGAPLISGNQACATQPHYAFADLLQSARSVADESLVEQMSAQGLQLLRDNPDFISPYGHHLRHFAVTGQLDAGLDIVRRLGPLADGADRNLFDFYRGARLVLQLADDQGRDDVNDLHASVDGKAEDLASRFDQRNGNTVFSDRLAADDAELASQPG